MEKVDNHKKFFPKEFSEEKVDLTEMTDEEVAEAILKLLDKFKEGE